MMMMMFTKIPRIKLNKYNILFFMKSITAGARK